MLPHQFRRLLDLLRKQSGTIIEILNEHNETRRQQEAAERTEAGDIAREVRAVSNAIDAERSDSNASSEKSYNQQERLIYSQDRVATWTFCAFIAAGVYALIAAWQGCMMHQTYSEIQKQTAAAQCAAKAAKSAAETAAGTLAENNLQFGLMFPQVRQQTQTAQSSLANQSPPYLVMSFESNSLPSPSSEAMASANPEGSKGFLHNPKPGRWDRR